MTHPFPTRRSSDLFNPVPGASLRLPGLDEPVKVWRAEAASVTADAAPGSIIQASADGIDVATGAGVLRLLELQRVGGKRRSEEHTSELQSLMRSSSAVFCLKKKKKT